MNKRVPRQVVEREIAALRLAIEGDAAGLHAHMAAMGFFAGDDPVVAPEALLRHFLDVTRWYVDDRDVTLDRELVAEVLIDFGDPRSPHWELIRHETVPADHLFGRRMEALVVAVLGRLGATANWHRIAREWLFGDPPETELGALEADFFARRRRAA
jgi:hypothetical protein